MGQIRFEVIETVRTNDLDKYDHLLPTAIFDYFQGLAGYHADLLKVGYADMMALKTIWVVVRQKFVVYQNPKMFEQIKLITYPSPPEAFYINRNYEVRNQNNDLLVAGQSLWVVVDSESRSMKRTKSVHYDTTDDYIETRALDESLERLDVFDKLDRTPDFTYFVMKSDLDHNMHMNNSRYCNLVLELLDLDSHISIKEMQIDFHKECSHADILKLYQTVNPDGTHTILGYKNDDTLSFVALVTLQSL